MGLNTKVNVSLWKDKAAIELNLAILYSFQVTIWIDLICMFVFPLKYSTSNF